MEIPGSLRKEHEELLKMLGRAMVVPGDVGNAARLVHQALIPHFRKEEELALPQLGYLTLSGEGPAEGAERLLELTERLREELPVMLKEHVQIAIALEPLHAAADLAGMDEYVRFADQLMLHAQMEEEILYPTSLLIGSYVQRSLVTRA